MENTPHSTSAAASGPDSAASDVYAQGNLGNQGNACPSLCFFLVQIRNALPSLKNLNSSSEVSRYNTLLVLSDLLFSDSDLNWVRNT